MTIPSYIYGMDHPPGTRYLRLAMRPSEAVPELHHGGIDCVLLTCFASEFSFLSIILQYSHIRLHRAETVEQADFLLLVTDATAFLTDVTYLDGTWREALRMCSENHRRVPSVIVADPADQPFLGDAYVRGACGVLWKPVEVLAAIDMIRTVHQAARDRKALLAELRQYPLDGAPAPHDSPK
jgi:DNA-binding NtrC family response regulator